MKNALYIMGTVVIVAGFCKLISDAAKKHLAKQIIAKYPEVQFSYDALLQQSVIKLNQLLTNPYA